eukprot:7384582-Prymnesium_polylepis.1
MAPLGSAQSSAPFGCPPMRKSRFSRPTDHIPTPTDPHPQTHTHRPTSTDPHPQTHTNRPTPTDPHAGTSRFDGWQCSSLLATSPTAPTDTAPTASTAPAAPAALPIATTATAATTAALASALRPPHLLNREDHIQQPLEHILVALPTRAREAVKP